MYTHNFTNTNKDDITFLFVFMFTYQIERTAKFEHNIPAYTEIVVGQYRGVFTGQTFSLSNQ